ncbi:uncharacterized protein [Atheta coriaria]|uniref:uncharacterized protein n=1 Tax=Dalotia coriaria TaxID=877792 RepID=UPI0031F41E86
MIRYSSHIRISLALVLVSIFLFQDVNAAKKKIPNFVKLCSRSSPKEEIQKCMADNIETFKPHLSAGIPEMRLRELDPLFLEKVVMEVPNFHIDFTNTTVNGASNFKVLNNSINFNENFLSLGLNFPFVRMEGDYQISGKLLVIQLESKGTFWLNTSNIDMYVELHGKRQEKNGKMYLDFNDKSKNSIQLNIIDTPLIHFNKLFENNEELTKTTNVIINDNVREIIKELMPIVNEILGSFVFNTVQTIFNTFTIDELFLQ